MRERLAQAAKLRYRYQQESWFVDAVEIYTDAVRRLASSLAETELKSRGFCRFREYASRYAQSPDFKELAAETTKVKDQLTGVMYSLRIHGNRITVSSYKAETDYAAEVLETFDKFKRGAVKDYTAKFKDFADMNHIEEGILYRVALLFPTMFSALDAYCERNRTYLDKVIGDFDREVQFYMAYLAFTHQFAGTDLEFCYPMVADESKEVCATETFDLALAAKLLTDSSTVVTNDFALKDPERLVVITGPNQGGKTTFARTFGQLHYLAALGCAVPGMEAHTFLFDKLFTHFERGENLTDLRGKLQDDLVRLHEILSAATPDSIAPIRAAPAPRELWQRPRGASRECASRHFPPSLTRRDHVATLPVATRQIQTKPGAMGAGLLSAVNEGGPLEFWVHVASNSRPAVNTCALPLPITL